MDCFHPVEIRTGQGLVLGRCGRCLSCLSHRQSDWTTRLRQEIQDDPEGAYFVTFTYDDEHVPRMKAKFFLPSELDENGETDQPLPDLLVVRKADAQKFHMDLRKRFQQGFFIDYRLYNAGYTDEVSRIDLPPCEFKFYLTSEYGPQTKRPHMHAIYFHLPQDESLVYDLISNVWNKGFITCEKAKSEAAAAYVAKYLINNSFIDLDPRVTKPFSLMSKGLGSSYLDNEKMLDWHRSAPVERCYTVVEGYKTTFPRYWREKIFDDSMKDQIVQDALDRASHFRSKEINEAELVRQAEWRFRKRNKIK